ncbi:MAG: hypothetical protein LBD78_06900 [Spirochaetaceae bacterium]|jgi:hypothetical protein|nr:hypothetical protein [Spirochaetaceae bacterium]
MAEPELVRVMDYILNRCNERDIEAVAAAVVKRRRNLVMFGGVKNMPDPQRLARDLSAQLNIEAGMEGVRKSIQEMAVRIIKQEAPELTDAQVAELTRAWVPPARDGAAGGNSPPRNLLESMIEQFVAFSTGRMSPEEDKSLRDEMGAWPDRYWKAFPPVVRLIITDFLKGGIAEGEFRTKLTTALSLC